MILGLGSDMVSIARIEEALQRFGNKFEERLFTASEQEKARRATEPRQIAATYAKRFAAKEAFAKALGTGIAGGIQWVDIEVVNDPLGKAQLQLHGRTKILAELQVPEGKQLSLHLSITDEREYAQAVVIISAD